MESSMIVKLNIAIYVSDYLTDGLVFVQIDSLNFGASPEALNADVIFASAIHWYSNT